MDIPRSLAQLSKLASISSTKPVCSTPACGASETGSLGGSIRLMASFSTSLTGTSERVAEADATRLLALGGVSSGPAGPLAVLALLLVPPESVLVERRTGVDVDLGSPSVSACAILSRSDASKCGPAVIPFSVSVFGNALHVSATPYRSDRAVRMQVDLIACTHLFGLALTRTMQSSATPKALHGSHGRPPTHFVLLTLHVSHALLARFFESCRPANRLLLSAAAADASLGTSLLSISPGLTVAAGAALACAAFRADPPRLGESRACACGCCC